MNDVVLKARPESASPARLAEFVRLAGQRRGLTAGERIEEIVDGLAATAGREPAAPVAARPFLKCLAALFADTPHRIAVDGDPALELPPRELASLGLIVWEAITNALRHAFPPGREGCIWVRLATDGHRLRLTVRDSGVGIGDLPDAPTGAWLIEALAERLGGYARLGSAPFGGGLVTVVCPAPA